MEATKDEVVRLAQRHARLTAELWGSRALTQTAEKERQRDNNLRAFRASVEAQATELALGNRLLEVEAQLHRAALACRL